MEEIEMELMARKDVAKTEDLALKLEENPMPEEDLYRTMSEEHALVVYL